MPIVHPPVDSFRVELECPRLPELDMSLAYIERAGTTLDPAARVDQTSSLENYKLAPLLSERLSNQTEHNLVDPQLLAQQHNDLNFEPIIEDNDSDEEEVSDRVSPRDVGEAPNRDSTDKKGKDKATQEEINN